MKTKIFNLIILDESGSMQSIKQTAIASMNETLQTIRAAESKYEDQEHYVSFVTFNDSVKTVRECAPAMEIGDITEADYHPDCCTALYDAMGMSINALRKKVAKGDRVLVTVITDGYENASKEYNSKAIKALVGELRGKGWVFAYIGANQDVEQVAKNISITNALQFESTKHGTANMGIQLSRSCDRLFHKIAEGLSNASEDNEDFFAI